MITRQRSFDYCMAWEGCFNSCNSRDSRGHVRRFIKRIKNSYSHSGEIFEELLLAHLDSLYAFALRLTRNPHAAEDLVQEASLRAFRGFSKLQE